MLIGIEATHANKFPRSGVENVCYYLINALKDVIPAEHKVILYSNKCLYGRRCQPAVFNSVGELVPALEGEKKEGFICRYVGLAILPKNWQSRILFWPFKKLWSQIRLSWELWRRPPDIFFAPGQLIPFFTPKKTVVLIHDSAFIRHPEAYGRLSRWYLQWMNKRIVHKAERIIVTAEFNKRELIDIYKISPEKIAVVPLAIDDEVFKFVPVEKVDRVLADKGIKSQYLLSVGRLENKKGTAILVRAWEKLRVAGQEVELVLVGEYGRGQTGQAARRAIEGSPYRDNIRVLPRVSFTDLPALYAGAAVFVFPSIYEGFGLPVLEAMASGAPVVATRAGALPEVMGGVGRLVEPGDTDGLATEIERLLNDVTERQRQRSLGFARAAEFSWEKTARGVGDILLD